MKKEPLQPKEVYDECEKAYKSIKSLQCKKIFIIIALYCGPTLEDILKKQKKFISEKISL